MCEAGSPEVRKSETFFKNNHPVPVKKQKKTHTIPEMLTSKDYTYFLVIALLGQVVGLLCCISDLIYNSVFTAVIAFVGTAIVGLMVVLYAAWTDRVSTSIRMLLTFVLSIAVAYLFQPDLKMFQVPSFFVSGVLDGVKHCRCRLIVTTVGFVAFAGVFAVFGSIILGVAFNNVLISGCLAKATGSIFGHSLRQNSLINSFNRN